MTGPRYVRLGGGAEVTAPEVGDALAARLVVAALRAGELVVLPTDTVYALAARAFDERAIGRVFEAKRRAPDKKLPLLIASADDLSRWAGFVPGYALALMQRYWPGALTLILDAGPRIPGWLCDERDAVAFRCPDFDLVRVVCADLGEPIAATSVNFSGQPEATSPQEIPSEILSAASLVIDGGPSSQGVSAVVDCTGERPVVVREGPLDLSLWL